VGVTLEEAQEVTVVSGTEGWEGVLREVGVMIVAKL
jgi:hypothetical protein